MVSLHNGNLKEKVIINFSFMCEKLKMYIVSYVSTVIQVNNWDWFKFLMKKNIHHI